MTELESNNPDVGTVAWIAILVVCVLLLLSVPIMFLL